MATKIWSPRTSGKTELQKSTFLFIASNIQMHMARITACAKFVRSTHCNVELFIIMKLARTSHNDPNANQVRKNKEGIKKEMAANPLSSLFLFK
eukprot:7599203-Pyramimonas_sp.AAC.1